MSARVVAALAGLVAAALLAVLVVRLGQAPTPGDAGLGSQGRAVPEPEPTALAERLRRIEERLGSLEVRPAALERSPADDSREQGQSLTRQVEALALRIEALERRPLGPAGASAPLAAPERSRGLPAPGPEETRTAPDVPAISGRIVRVGEDATLAINVGSHNTVPEGCEFWIFRGDEYVGRVRVTRLGVDMSDVVPADGTRWSDYKLGDMATTWVGRAALPERERR